MQEKGTFPEKAHPLVQCGQAESGYQALTGYRLLEWSPGHALLGLDVRDIHLNRAGTLHGGMILALLDTVCGYAGCYCEAPDRVRLAVTLSMNSQFIGQVKGGRITARGNVTGGGRKIFFANGEVRDAAGTLLATGSGSYRYRSGSEGPEGIERP